MSSQVARQPQKMEENIFGAHAPNVELKKLNLSKRKTKTASSRRGHFASTGADLFLQHGIPWLGKKAVEMGRYYGSEGHRGNTFFDVTVTGQWSSPSGCLVLPMSSMKYRYFAWF